MEKIFQIFKAGTHVTMAGHTTAWTRNDLANIAATYPLPAFAPLVLGHPKDNRPVLGFVKRLFAVNEALFALADVGDDLISMVRRGLYRNISAAFDAPTPETNSWTLRHVGFLGAVPPAVRGLAPLNFAAFGHDQAVAFAGPCDFGECREQAEFTVPAGFQVDPDAMKTFVLVEQFRRACPGLSVTEAALLITRPAY